MEAPQSPIDIRVTLGSEKDCQNLVNIDIDFNDKKQDVKAFLQAKKLGEGFDKDCALIFDLFTQQGKQKEAIEYFSEANGKSPLQIVFNNRPSEGSDFCKFSMEPHEGFIRILYRFTPQQSELLEINHMLGYFSNNGLKLQSHVNLEMKGKIFHTNNNRANVLVDYTKFHLISNAFCSQNLMNSLLQIPDLINNCEYYIKNPFFSLIKKSRVAKVNLQMDSFRKLSKYYNKMSQQGKEKQTKEFKYVNRGIFRQKAEGTLIYNNEYMINVQSKYEGEDVFIRLVKVYSKFFQNLLDTTFYYDD